MKMREMKHAALLQPWSGLIAACRSSGKVIPSRRPTPASSSFTLLETAKANGLNPEAYLNHLLTVLPERFNADPHGSVDDLLPWCQEMQRAFMPEISDVDH